MAVSKRARYEVFRRDNHACRYCGAKAPEAILTIDHVMPVALGGSDDPSNLVTACADCNAGKSSTTPDDPLVEDVSEDAARWARAMEQAISEASKDHRSRIAYGKEFVKTWEIWDPKLEALPGDFIGMLDYWHSVGLPQSIVSDAVNLAWGRPYLSSGSVFRYTIGILRNKIADIQERAAELMNEAESDD